MHRLVRKLALVRRPVIVSYTLIAIIAIAACINIGCGTKPTTRKLIWNLSKSREIGCISGGKWISDIRQLYYLKGDQGLRLSVILKESKCFDFDSASDIYVDASRDKITCINIASFGYSKEKVVERLREMHQQWNGKSIGKIEKWIKDTEKKGGSRSHSSTIQREDNQDQPEIRAEIHNNFGGKNNAWYIMTTFSWPREVAPEPNAEVTPEPTQ